jgi:rare lipoprotein A
MSVQSKYEWVVGIVALLFVATAGIGAPRTQVPTTEQVTPAQPKVADDSKSDSASQKPLIDRSGRKRVGKASFYANRFGGRKMADGQRMDLKDSNAASRTLPLGTTAKVTNLETGKSAVVTIQDRGPYVGGRIVDLSPSTAQKIGISRREGVAKVEVVPIAVPLPDGSVKPGAAADDPILALDERRDRGAQSQADWDDWH